MEEPIWFKLMNHCKNIQRVKLSPIRQSKINKKNFTIIANNCWGGMVYESYNLIKQSPTVGLYILPSDYLKFIKNLRDYLNYNLQFIDPRDSKNREYIIKEIKDKKFGTYPIGKLNDIEIYFLHYDSKKSARDKWNRRVKRIDWNNILYKFNDQNGCTNEQLREFDSLDFKNKICFTVREGLSSCKSVYRVKNPLHQDHVNTFEEPYGCSSIVNVNEIINNL